MVKIGTPRPCESAPTMILSQSSMSSSRSGVATNARSPTTSRNVGSGPSTRAPGNMNSNARPSVALSDMTSTGEGGVAAMRDLLESMKLRTSIVNQEIAVIGRESERLGVLASALDAKEKIDALYSTLALRDSARSAQIEELKGELRSVLKERVLSEIEHVIKTTIADHSGIRAKVSQELASQIPPELIAKVKESKRRLQQIQMDLYNSEARRLNAHVASRSLSEPLRPLLRPLAMPLSSNTAYANGAAVPPTPAQPAPPPVTPATPQAHLSTLSPASSSDSVASWDMDMDAPTPSDRFPRDLREFAGLDDEAIRSLLFDYNLENGNAGTVDREKDMNKFLSHIGVQLQVTPLSANPARSGRLPVVFTSTH